VSPSGKYFLFLGKSSSMKQCFHLYDSEGKKIVQEVELSVLCNTTTPFGYFSWNSNETEVL
jgi:hypothetical protein